MVSANQDQQPQGESTDWMPVTAETLTRVPVFVAEMVMDLSEGEEAPQWALRTLPYDWEALDDLPIDAASVYEIWTQGWFRRGSNGSCSLWPIPMGYAGTPWPEPLAWIVQREATPERSIIVWQVVVALQGEVDVEMA